jgi:phosphatidate cytidylyltransferase
MDSNVVRRVAFAAAAIPIALGIVYLGGIPLVALVAVAGGLGARELYDLAARVEIRPFRALGVLLAMTFAPVTYAALVRPDVALFLDQWWPFGIGLGLIVMLIVLLAARLPEERPLASIAVTIFGAVYTGALPAFLLAIRHGQHSGSARAGTMLVFFPLVVTWVCDTAAMFGGRAMKGPKLAPTVSPGKTWSGTLSGVVGALIVVPLWLPMMFGPAGVSITYVQALIMAATLSVVGQLGDLVESLFKREAGVKDSSHLIPGHGGVLDRLDSLYFVVPVAALLYRVFGVI